MRVRSRLAGAPRDAELRLYRLAGQRRFVLVVREPDGRHVPVGRLTAAIGYELVDAGARERAALTLAGFHLPEAGRRLDASQRLMKAIHDSKAARPPQDEARGPHFDRLPAGRHATTSGLRNDNRTKGIPCSFRK